MTMMERCRNSLKVYPIKEDWSNGTQEVMLIFLGASVRYLWILPVFMMILIGYRMRTYMFNENYNLITVSGLVLLSLCMDFVIFLYIHWLGMFFFKFEYIPEEPGTQACLLGTGYSTFKFYHFWLLMASTAIPWINADNFTHFFWIWLGFFVVSYVFESLLEINLYLLLFTEDYTHIARWLFLVFGEYSSYALNTLFHTKIIELLQSMIPRYINVALKSIYSGKNKLVIIFILALFICPWLVFIHHRSLMRELAYPVFMQAFFFTTKFYAYEKTLHEESTNFITRKVWNIIRPRTNSCCFWEGKNCAQKEKLYAYSDYILWRFTSFSNLWLPLITLLLILIITAWLSLERKAARLRRTWAQEETKLDPS